MIVIASKITKKLIVTNHGVLLELIILLKRWFYSISFIFSLKYFTMIFQKIIELKLFRILAIN